MSISLEHVNRLVNSLDNSEPETVKALIAVCQHCDGVEEIQTSEFEGMLYVIRHPETERPVWIIDHNGAATTLYDAADWASAVADYARDHGWDNDTAPEIPDASERAGVHEPTGIQYAPSRAQEIEARSEAAQCALYREIVGLD